MPSQERMDEYHSDYAEWDRQYGPGSGHVDKGMSLRPFPPPYPRDTSKCPAP